MEGIPGGAMARSSNVHGPSVLPVLDHPQIALPDRPELGHARVTAVVPPRKIYRSERLINVCAFGRQEKPILLCFQAPGRAACRPGLAMRKPHLP